MLLLLLTLNAFRFLGKRFKCFEQVFIFKMLEVLDEIRIYLLDKKIRKVTKLLREKQKFRYPDNAMTKMT